MYLQHPERVGPIPLYGYTPEEWLAHLMLALFGVSTRKSAHMLVKNGQRFAPVLHFLQAIRYRMWFLLTTAVVAGVLELIGWAGRLWSSHDVLSDTAFSIQFVCTVIGPTPLIAANFIILGHVIRRLGQQYSRLNARSYTAVFLGSDIISLVVQAVGGTIAAIAAKKYESPQTGTNMTLAGIVFQTVALTLYITLASEFLLRYYLDRPISGSGDGVNLKYTRADNKTHMLIGSLIFSSLCFYVRAWYRCIELGGGWSGRVIRTQRYFVIMDAVMIVLAMWTLNMFHPAYLLGYGSQWRSETTNCVRGLDSQFLESSTTVMGTDSVDFDFEHYVTVGVDGSDIVVV
ncbi:hypothetical protein FOMPIDRAFT_87149 [Fomitopsis schrenkii]|uniref:RTA1-domain-containing protein n=1 Tax=Fomitopsis schrenkii TaxID=2126942 RepID=S8EKL2_FOMSC|nr:hypothetical protein FOMPIDRAFT_87149 [Fomitopsis schrenkii]